MYFKKYGKFFVLSISCMFLIACSEPSAGNTKAKQIKNLSLPPYTIFKTSKESTNSVSFHVQIPERVTKEQLKMLLKQLDAQWGHLESVDIYFYISDDPKTYWVTANLGEKDFGIFIWGSTKEQHDQVAALDPQIQGQVVGIWHAAYGKTLKKGQQDHREPADYKIVIEKIGNKTVVRYLFADGTVRQQDIKVIKQNGKIRYMTAVGEQYHESYQINKQGDLEFWCYDNLYYTAPKIQSSATGVKS